MPYTILVSNWSLMTEEKYLALRQAGIEFLTEPVNVKGNRLIFFADCDGNLLHLVQREKPLP